MFSRDSTPLQHDIDGFFRSKPELTVKHIGNIMEAAVRMKKQRRQPVTVLSLSSLEHMMSQLKSKTLTAHVVQAMLFSLQAVPADVVAHLRYLGELSE